MPRVLLLLTAIACFSLLPHFPASAQTTLYELTSESQMATGCIGPSLCLCPAKFIGEVQGSFEVHPLSSAGPLDLFLVEAVNWVVNENTPDEITVTGSGTYLVDPEADIQEMVLDLVVNGAAQEFMSVDVVGGGRELSRDDLHRCLQ